MLNRNLICPHCQSQMQRVRKPRNIYWACPRCGGRSSTIGLMRQSMPEGFVNGLWQQIRRGQPPKVRSCPACSQLMAQIYVEEGAVLIDVCGTCTFVWFDPEEYAAMPRTPSKPEPIKADLPPEAKRLLAMEDIRQRRETAHREKSSPDELWKILPAVFGMPVEFDYKRTRTYPYVTWSVALLIAAISIIAFIDLDSVVDSLGLIPADWNRLSGFTFLTSFFLHGGLFHLVSNLYFLLVFGDNVEDHLGPPGYIFLLLCATAGGGLAHVLADPSSTIPCVGASGGISALLIYYALQFPGARIGFLFWFRWVRLPVLGYVFFWVVLQLVGTQFADTQVAYGAHLGGAAVGLLAWLMQKYVVKSDS